MTAVVDLFAYARQPFAVGPSPSVVTRADEPAEVRTIIVVPGWRYRACASCAMRLDGVPLPAKTPALVVFTETRARVTFLGRGLITLTPTARVAQQMGDRS